MLVTLEPLSIPVDDIIDTTAAGDAFCGGVLYALSKGNVPSDIPNLFHSTVYLLMTHH